VLAVLACSALFLLVVYYIYAPRQTGAFVGDGIRTAEQRKASLIQLRAKETNMAANYGWIDRKTGVVRLPVDRAMELTVQHYAARK
jgi:hypothetical protein